MIRPFLSLFVLLFACIASVGGVQADEPQIAWPQGWVVEPLPADAAASGPCDNVQPRAIRQAMP